MKQLVVSSGKGGTGKTSVVAALAHLAAAEARIVLVDADVDASNLSLVLSGEVRAEEPFLGGQTAVIDPKACLGCGICATVCRFDAVHAADGHYRVDSMACEGCAACIHQCPERAIHAQVQQAGVSRFSETRFGPFFHARLFAGQENSGKLVALVTGRARDLARDDGRGLVLVDGPPGIGCPVLAAATGADFSLVVSEPSAAGVHDLERILATLSGLGVPAAVAINKADVHAAQAARLRALCRDRGVDVIGAVPYDDVVTEAMVRGLPVTVYRPTGPVSEALRRLWRELAGRLATLRPRGRAIPLAG